MGVREFSIKDDGRNPSASFKDRASSVALLRAKDLGHELVTGASTSTSIRFRFVPVTVTEPPPAIGPLVGETEVTVGAEGSVC